MLFFLFSPSSAVVVVSDAPPSPVCVAPPTYLHTYVDCCYCDRAEEMFFVCRRQLHEPLCPIDFVTGMHPVWLRRLVAFLPVVETYKRKERGFNWGRTRRKKEVCRDQTETLEMDGLVTLSASHRQHHTTSLNLEPMGGKEKWTPEKYACRSLEADIKETAYSWRQLEMLTQDRNACRHHAVGLYSKRATTATCSGLLPAISRGMSTRFKVHLA